MGGARSRDYHADGGYLTTFGWQRGRFLGTCNFGITVLLDSGPLGGSAPSVGTVETAFVTPSLLLPARPDSQLPRIQRRTGLCHLRSGPWLGTSGRDL